MRMDSEKSRKMGKSGRIVQVLASSVSVWQNEVYDSTSDDLDHGNFQQVNFR